MAVQRSLEKELKALLSLRVTDEEAVELEKKGFAVKRPTKLTLLAVALLEKGMKGDLSAAKEIAQRVGGEERETGGVILIDDVGN